jgi:hypothetical protein
VFEVRSLALREEYELQLSEDKGSEKYLDLRKMKKVKNLEGYITRNSVICTGHLILL